VDQTEQRARRRAQLEVVYCGDSDLLAQVHDIVTPLVRRVAKEPKRAAFRSGVDEIAAAVYALATEVVRLPPPAGRRPCRAGSGGGEEGARYATARTGAN
jgi:hypothetical protein